ncbi:hypothetical protein QTO34_007089 [Cnephaeus nilssonii]|uniref:AarF domain-containing protein kinase 1 n=1 Tax=Cnephaeus nilssonii TaxID=3371016 RepID=A0AA40LI25_CNENI|nr:hypothetical protein QTO34_007089 [Eptesicus nilssonii]
MGISRDNWHKRCTTGGKRKPYHKKQKQELGHPAANTNIGPCRIDTICVWGGNKRYRAFGPLDPEAHGIWGECCAPGPSSQAGGGGGGSLTERTLMRIGVSNRHAILSLPTRLQRTPARGPALSTAKYWVNHRSRETVAVKVQLPKVQVQSSKDIPLMGALVLAAKQLFPEFEFMWLVDEAKKNLPLELDFLSEGRKVEKVAQMLKHFDFLKVPQIHWELSTKRVPLMEFLDGGQVNDRDYMERNKIDVNEISRHLGKGPDSGKVEIVLLDQGLYQVLTEAFRPNYCHLRQSLIWTDMEKNSVNSGISQAPVTATENTEICNNAATYLPQISQFLPRQMLLIFKTNDLLRGIEATVGTCASASSFLNMSRCCVRVLATHKKNTCSFFRRTQISFSETFSLWQISLH